MSADSTKTKDTSGGGASVALFGHLCELLEQYRGVGGSESKERLLREYFAWWRQQQADVYPALRLMVPAADAARARFGLREKTLARMYIHALGIDGQPAAEGLREWQVPDKNTHVRCCSPSPSAHVY